MQGSVESNTVILFQQKHYGFVLTGWVHGQDRNSDGPAAASSQGGLKLKVFKQMIKSKVGDTGDHVEGDQPKFQINCLIN